MTLSTATYDTDTHKIVPIEPTEDMTIKGNESKDNWDNDFPNDFEVWSGCKQAHYLANRCYQTMIAAAPEHQSLGSAQVIPWNGITSLDLNPNQILETAIDKCEGVIVIGFKKDNEGLYAASSYADGGTALWLLEKFKLNLLTGNHEG